VLWVGGKPHSIGYPARDTCVYRFCRHQGALYEADEKTSYVVILSPSLVMLSGAKHLSSSAQGKLREESMLFISSYCEMLRGVYPKRGMKGILRCAQNDKRRACPPFDFAQGQCAKSNCERSEWDSA